MLFNFPALREARIVPYSLWVYNRCVITWAQVHLRRLGILNGN